MITTGTTNSSLTAAYINPVILATRKVFETMLECTPKRTGLSLKESTVEKLVVSAVIGISGNATGTIIVRLSRQAAFAVLDRMVGVEASEINSDVCDAIGELTNMIAGAAKARMSELNLSISIPNIISGEDHEVFYPSNVEPICLSYESEIGPFAIEVGFTSLA